MPSGPEMVASPSLTLLQTDSIHLSRFSKIIKIQPLFYFLKLKNIFTLKLTCYFIHQTYLQLIFENNGKQTQIYINVLLTPFLLYWNPVLFFPCKHLRKPELRLSFWALPVGQRYCYVFSEVTRADAGMASSGCLKC